MKTIFIIIAGLFFALSVFAQNGKPLLGKSNFMSEEDKAYSKLHWTQQSSGYLLRQASLDFIGSGACALTGVGIGFGSYFIDDPEDKKILLVSSGVLGIVSTCLFIKGAINIGRAGKVSDSREFPIAQLGPSKEGLGVKLTF
ncbi:MAG: hypothetical protein LBU37_04105 [Tannerellaceae bacterium]|jgi:hypothetical protein|nr:hypothetical protein [Tannerellaceae bacterium]